MSEKSNVLPEENIYYNVNVTNNSPTPKVASYSSNLTVPLLEKSREYSMSITRLYIPGTAIPIFNMRSSPNSYFISLGYRDPPTTPVSLPVLYDPNWGNLIDGAIWSYQQFLDMMNATFEAIYDILVVVGDPSDAPPVIYFDSAAQLFRIRFVTNNDMLNYIIYFNNPLFQMFPTFPARHLAYNSPDYLDFMLANNSPNPANYDLNYAISPPPQGYIFSTEDNCQYAWNGLVRVFITSGGLRTRSEFQYTATGGSIGMPIITDFEPTVNGDFRVNNVIQYYPTGELRRLDLLNDGPLTQIDFQFWYEDKWGKTYPMYLGSDKFLSLKLLFQKKK